MIAREPTTPTTPPVSEIGTAAERRADRRRLLDAVMFSAFGVSLVIGLWVANRASIWWALVLLLVVTLPLGVVAYLRLADVGPTDGAS